MASSDTRRYPINAAICIDYNELITNAKFHTREECIYKVGIQCCDRCYRNINEVSSYNTGTVGCKINLHPNATTKDSLSHTSLQCKESYDNLSLGGMWACEYVANIKLENTRDYSIVLNFDICMDCYETIIGPMQYKLYKNNPKIDGIKHDIVIKGQTKYYTCRVMPNAYYLCVYIIDEFTVSDTELKESIDELQIKINKLIVQNTNSPDVMDVVNKMDTES